MIGTDETGSSYREFRHVPVMLDEVVNIFHAAPTGTIVDATCGGAGHSAALLRDRGDQLLLGIDRDLEAVAIASTRLEEFHPRAQVVHARFDELAQVVGGRQVSAVLFDLGVSSAQFDWAERGFSYRNDAPLDMRMDTSDGESARDLLNSATVAELRSVISANSDERFADRIARAIVANRPLETTTQLAQIVVDAIPAPARRKGGHPAKRTFQALRIEINDELRILKPAIDAAIDALIPGGLCMVISYHSGEDKIVKACFRLAETGGCSCPSGLPCVCGALPRGRMLRRGVMRPSEAEIASNPRAASAVARVFQKSATPVQGASTLPAAVTRTSNFSGPSTGSTFFTTASADSAANFPCKDER